MRPPHELPSSDRPWALRHEPAYRRLGELHHDLLPEVGERSWRALVPPSGVT